MQPLIAFAFACAFASCAGTTVLAAPAQDAPPASAAPQAGAEAAEPQAQAAPAEPTSPAAQQPAQSGLVPVNQVDAPAFTIPDIRAHRGQELSYVRRAADRVVVDLGVLDFDADPVLLIGDEPVSRNAYRRRALMYAGGNEIDKHVTHLLTQNEIERQVLQFAGSLGGKPEDPSIAGQVAEYRKRFELDPAAIDRKYEEYKDMLRQQSRQGATLSPGDPDPAEPALTEFEESIHSSIGMEAYRQMLAADAAFEKVFLPFPAEKVAGEAHKMESGPPPLDEPRPDWMPQTTWDALAADDQSRNLRSFVKSWAVSGEGIPGMFKPVILARVRQGLIEQTGITFFFDGELPDDIFMSVGGRVVPLDDIWYLVENKLTDADNDLIVRELLTLAGMKQALTAAGKWLAPDVFAESWRAENQKYVGTIFPLSTIAMFRGYTSLDRYREHYRYREAYNLWRKATLTDEEVIEHYQGGGRLLFERGNLVVDIAFRELAGRPFNNGTLDACEQELKAFMDEAKAAWQAERAQVVAAAAAEGGGGEAAVAAAVQADERENGPGDAAWFARVARQHPSPPSPQGGDAHNFQRSQIRMRMAEDELSIFLTGYSLADDVFYHGQKGQVYGPWAERCRQHAWGAEANAGAWAVAVKDFTRSGPVGAFEGRNRDLAYEDFLDLHYFHWAQESLKALLPSVKVAAAGAGAR